MYSTISLQSPWFFLLFLDAYRDFGEFPAIYVRAPLSPFQEHHNSEARALCMVHAVNKLVPELVPNSVEIISDWVDDVGLDASIMTDEDARTAAEVNVGVFPPEWSHHLFGVEACII